MSQVLSLRVSDTLIERLEQFARRQGNGMTRARASLILLEESLREAEFASIEFRDSPVGRQPYLKGSGLAIWEVVMIVRSFDFDAEQMSKSYPYPSQAIQAAIDYYEAFRSEIDLAIEDNHVGIEAVKRQLPNLQIFVVPQETTVGQKRFPMLSFLLDENISPEVATQVLLKRPEIPILSVHHWRDGAFKARQDERILIAASVESLTLVTYDQWTIMPLLVRWGQSQTISEDWHAP